MTIEMKICSACGIAKPITAFSKRKDCKDGLRKQCTACRSAVVLAHAHEHIEESYATHKRWRERNKQMLADKKAAWYQVNRDRSLARTREWFLSHRSRAAAHWATRRADKLRATPPWAPMNVIAAFYSVRDMLNREGSAVYHVDHIIPLRNPSVCGLHVPANLRIITDKENLRKGNKFCG